MSVMAFILGLSLITSSIFCVGMLLVYRKSRQMKLAMLEAQETLGEKNIQLDNVSAMLAKMTDNYNRSMLFDDVTGLPNRRVFDDRLSQTFAQSKRYHLIFAVLFIDIDEFKIINDALGHDVGDALLMEVVSRLKPCIRQVDTLARFGGDEFVVILPQLSKPETAAFVAQRLIDAISQPCHVGNHELFITASIGVSVFPADGDDAKVLVKNADIALHQAKTRGRNTYQFYREEMFTLSQRELILNSSLHRDSIFDEFVIFYQPQLNVGSRKIIAMEALLRWQHPDLGMITPAEFLRLAENNGRMIPLGEWVLRQACQQFLAWQQEGFHPQAVAVNVSMRQLENPHFVYKVSQIMQEMNFTPACLILEISENLLMPNIASVEKTLHMLKHLGVQIAIDDFGTGFLSLQHLQRFPIDSLKIDLTFTQNITINKESLAIARMIVGLANSLHLTVIAEGVENQKQKQVLKELGCHLMQGHYFSYPLLPKDFTAEVLKNICANA